jgi:hypothetical protein
VNPLKFWGGKEPFSPKKNGSLYYRGDIRNAEQCLAHAMGTPETLNNIMPMGVGTSETTNNILPML